MSAAATLFLAVLFSAQEARPAAGVELAAAKRKAAEENQRVLVFWGGEHDANSKQLQQSLRRDPELSRELLYEYQTVRVDVRRDEDAAALAAACGLELATLAIPHLSVLDSAGKVLAQQPVGEAAPQPVLEFLRGQRAAPRNAETRLPEALATAAKERKRVFLAFGAPW